MLARLVALFVCVPLVELYLLFKLHEWTESALLTIGLILLTGFLGAWLAKQQGLSTIQKIQTAVAEGRMPASELVDGAMILIAGALLLTPGILTDAFGFSLLLPPCRRAYRRLLKTWFPTSNVSLYVGMPGQAPTYENDPSVVDGTATKAREDDL